MTLLAELVALLAPAWMPRLPLRAAARRGPAVRRLLARAAVAPRGLPALRPARSPRQALSRGARLVPARLGAAGLPGRRAQARGGAEVPRRTRGRGPDGGPHGREPPARPARPRPRVARARPAGRPAAQAHAGFDQARVLGVALARRTERPLVECLVRTDRAHAPGRREPRERRAPGRLQIHVRGVAAAAARSSSTTSTRRARRSTPAPARSPPRARPSSPRSPTPARCEG